MRTHIITGCSEPTGSRGDRVFVMDKLSPSNMHPDSYAEVLSPRISGHHFKRGSFKEVVMGGCGHWVGPVSVAGICKPPGGVKPADTLMSGFQPGELRESKPLLHSQQGLWGPCNPDGLQQVCLMQKERRRKVLQGASSCCYHQEVFS